MDKMFLRAESFNQDIGVWNTSQVRYMDDMFYYASSFNQDIGRWDTRTVLKMDTMFDRASSFNQSLADWCLPLINDEPFLFANNSALQASMFPSWGRASPACKSQITEFSLATNQVTVLCPDVPVGTIGRVDGLDEIFLKVDWHILSFADTEKIETNSFCTTGITEMDSIFSYKDFNQDISRWDTSLVASMDSMFLDASTFSQNISSWCVQKIPTMPEDFATGSALSQDVLPSWGEPCP
jgi:hypothetical protein